MLDSIDITTTEINNTMATRTFTESSKKHNQIPPAAADILGVSYMSNTNRDSISIMQTNTSVYYAGDDENATTSKTVENNQKYKGEQAVFKIPQRPVFSKADSLETQLLTDSELFLIDNLCKDMYSVHNQTIDSSCNNNNNPYELTTRNALGVVPRKQQQIDRIEFVSSLLKPDKKV